MATVAKAIGEKWRGLSDEDKAGYKEKATQRAAEQAAAEAGAATADGAGGMPVPHACTTTPLPCPASILLRLPSCKQVSGLHAVMRHVPYSLLDA